jgi:hypothetical protein
MHEIGEIMGCSGRRFVDGGKALGHNTVLLLLLLLQSGIIFSNRAVSVRVHILAKERNLLVACHRQRMHLQDKLQLIVKIGNKIRIQPPPARCPTADSSPCLV